MTDKQLLHMVIGGVVKDPKKVEFKNIDEIEVVGFYPNFAEAEKEWRNKAQSTVDNANMRYFVVHLHKLFEPDLKDNKN